MRPENENTVLVYLYSEQTTNVTRNMHIKGGIIFARRKIYFQWAMKAPQLTLPDVPVAVKINTRGKSI